MTREEKLANDVWYYIRDWQKTLSYTSATPDTISQAAVKLDRALIRAIRSKKK